MLADLFYMCHMFLIRSILMGIGPFIALKEHYFYVNIHDFDFSLFPFLLKEFLASSITIMLLLS